MIGRLPTKYVMKRHEESTLAPLVYSISDLPNLIGLGLSRVKLEIAEGRLKTIRSGRRRLVPATALHDWIAARETEAAEREGRT